MPPKKQKTIQPYQQEDKIEYIEQQQNNVNQIVKE
ncbi:unnamed protein product [Paramecium sonneborni]|uniref:Uncharacterized protein n=1 Tax=Paramecium sonneborni TaxID=65129 RepID=A0A8S1PWG0_9CILI|nr:unnamed protein product [Paramecium sonneborni]